MKHQPEEEALEEAENPFWITYSDLLSSLLLVFLALLFAFQALSTIQAQLLTQQMQAQKQTHLQLEKLKDKLDSDRRQFSRFVEELKKLQQIHKEIKVDPRTGDVTIETSEEWFQSNRAELLGGARSFLSRLMPSYVRLVTHPAYKDTIKQVIVEGHADAEGSSVWETNYRDNLTLSQARAREVNDYVLDILDPVTRERFRRLSSVAGRSNVQMIIALDQRPGPPQAPTAQMLQTKGKRYRNVKLHLDWRNPLIEYDILLNLKEP